MEVGQNFFSQCYLPHKCKLGKSDFVCKSKLIGGLNGTQPATFEFIDKSFSQNSQCSNRLSEQLKLSYDDLRRYF